MNTLRRWGIQLAFGLVLAGVTASWAGQLAEQAVGRVTTERLLDAGARANATMQQIEQEQLALVRSITFTEGVAPALAAEQAALLQGLIAPLQANSSVPMVNLLGPDATIILAIRSADAPAPPVRRTDWQVVAKALSSDADQLEAQHWTALESVAAGLLVITAGPVWDEENMVGAVATAMPTAQLLERLAGNAPLQLTLYSEQGEYLASTGSTQPPSVDPNLAQTIINGSDPAAPRHYSRNGIKQSEILGRLIIRNQPAAVLGVATDDDSAAVRRSVTILVAVGMAATALALGTLLGRFIYRRAQ